MSRQIVCEAHGKIQPTHPEDAARGLFARYVRGTTKHDLVCDVCDRPLPSGSPAVAISIPSDQVRQWESECLYFAHQPEDIV